MAVGTNLLKDRFPAIFAEIHPTLNKDIDIHKLTCGSSKRIWWKCSTWKECEHHIWPTAVSNRTNQGNICPYCSPAGSRRTCPCKSFMNVPSLAKEFTLAGDLNAGIDPWVIGMGSGKNLWWKCSEAKCDHHVWPASLNKRTNGNKLAKCPFCFNGTSTPRCCPCNSFMNIPILAQQFIKAGELNKNVDPWAIAPGSGVKVWWKCLDAKCDHHVWNISPHDRTNSINDVTSCPFCFNGVNILKCCSCESFMNDSLLSTEFTLAGHLNNDINPYEISKGSGIKLWWKCSKAKCDHHIWPAQVCTRTRERKIDGSGSGCPYCYNGASNLGICCPCDSFMNDPVLAKEFTLAGDLNAGINPWQLFGKSNKYVWWKCAEAKCNHHIWETSVCSRTLSEKCPFCEHKNGCIRRCCPCSSFMNNKELASEFHAELNPDIDPWTISRGSGQNILWKCAKTTCLYIWHSNPDHRVSRNQGCPQCYMNREESLGASLVRKVLTELKFDIKSEHKYLEYLPTRRYDFVVQNEKGEICFEFDGDQHFKFVPWWHKTNESFLEKQEIDRIKTLVLMLLGIPLIRISNNNEDHIRNTIKYFLDMDRKTTFLGIDDVKKYEYMKQQVNLDSVTMFCPKFAELLNKSNNRNITLKILNIPQIDNKSDVTIGVQQPKHRSRFVSSTNTLPLSQPVRRSRFISSTNTLPSLSQPIRRSRFVSSSSVSIT